MLHDVVADPAARTEAELLAAHTGQLADAIATVGVETAAEATGLPASSLEAIAAGDVGAAADLELETAAAILALVAGNPPADEIAAAARDDLLFGMTAGVLSVDVVAGEAARDVEPREVQGMVEGRHPMTLRAYVDLQQVIADRGP